MEHGADINKGNSNGATPLYIACKNGYIEVVKYLVEHGVDINKKDINGATTLYIAYENGHIEVVKYLVEQGADINREIIMVLLYILHVKKDISKS